MSAQYSSRAPLVTAWLLANLPAALSLDTKQVHDGPPTDGVRATCVILGDTEYETDWAALGARNREETATLQCSICVLGPGQTQTQVNEAAYALLGLIDLYLRAQIGTISAAAPGLWTIAVAPVSLTKQIGDNARYAFLDFDIRYSARI